MSDEDRQAAISAGYNPYDPGSMAKLGQIQKTIQTPMQTSLGSRIGPLAAGVGLSVPILGPLVSAIADRISGKADTLKKAIVGNDPTGELTKTMEAGGTIGLLAQALTGTSPISLVGKAAEGAGDLAKAAQIGSAALKGSTVIKDGSLLLADGSKVAANAAQKVGNFVNKWGSSGGIIGPATRGAAEGASMQGLNEIGKDDPNAGLNILKSAGLGAAVGYGASKLGKDINRGPQALTEAANQADGYVMKTAYGVGPKQLKMSLGSNPYTAGSGLTESRVEAAQKAGGDLYRSGEIDPLDVKIQLAEDSPMWKLANDKYNSEIDKIRFGQNNIDNRTPEEIGGLYQDIDDSALSNKIKLVPVSSDKLDITKGLPDNVILHGSDEPNGLEVTNKTDRSFSATTDINTANRYGENGDIYAAKIINPNRILDLSDESDRLKLANIIAEHGDSGSDIDELAGSLENHNLESDFQIPESYGRDNRLMEALRHSGYAGAVDKYGNYDVWDINAIAPYTSNEASNTSGILGKQIPRIMNLPATKAYMDIMKNLGRGDEGSQKVLDLAKKADATGSLQGIKNSLDINTASLKRAVFSGAPDADLSSYLGNVAYAMRDMASTDALQMADVPEGIKKFYSVTSPIRLAMVHDALSPKPMFVNQSTTGIFQGLQNMATGAAAVAGGAPGLAATQLAAQTVQNMGKGIGNEFSGAISSKVRPVTESLQPIAQSLQESGIGKAISAGAPRLAGAAPLVGPVIRGLSGAGTPDPEQSDQSGAFFGAPGKPGANQSGAIIPKVLDDRLNQNIQMLYGQKNLELFGPPTADNPQYQEYLKNYKQLLMTTDPTTGQPKLDPQKAAHVLFYKEGPESQNLFKNYMKSMETINQLIPTAGLGQLGGATMLGVNAEGASSRKALEDEVIKAISGGGGSGEAFRPEISKVLNFSGDRKAILGQLHNIIVKHNPRLRSLLVCVNE
jgi:hypothetical protein